MNRYKQCPECGHTEVMEHYVDKSVDKELQHWFSCMKCKAEFGRENLWDEKQKEKQ